MKVVARAYGRGGQGRRILKGESEPMSLPAAMSWADKNHPNQDITIRSEYTSEGTKHPGFRGRVEASRKMKGRWHREHRSSSYLSEAEQKRRLNAALKGK